MLQIVEMKIGDIKPFALNPKEHPKAQIAQIKRSIQEYGMLDPVAVDENNVLIEGHGRLLALQELGAETVPTIRLTHLTEAQKKAYIIGHNKMTLNSGFDEGLLSQLLTEIDSAGFDVEMTGFDLSEIDALMSPKDCVEDNFDEKDEDAVKKKIAERGGAVTQSGDIWRLGEHVLMCGDSTNPNDFSKLMDGQKAALCVTSPPYGVGKEYEKKGLEPWFELMRPAVKNITRHAETVIINLGDMFNTGGQFIEPTFSYCLQMLAEQGFRPLWIRIWDKQRQALSSAAPFHLSTSKPVGDAEWLGAFGKSNADKSAVATSGNGGEGNGESESDIVVLDDHGYIIAAASHSYKYVKRLSRADRKAWGYASMWRIASVVGTPSTKGKLDERNHRARFPVELPARCIKMHSDAGNVVLEPFSGSGTTIIAAEQLKRRCFAMERDESYTDIAVARFHKFAPDKEVTLVRDGREIPLAETGLLDIDEQEGGGE